MDGKTRSVFITGGTGYLGRPLIGQLLARGHEVRALVRPDPRPSCLRGARRYSAMLSTGKTYADKIQPADTFVQLVGIAHPEPVKRERIPADRLHLRLRRHCSRY